MNMILITMIFSQKTRGSQNISLRECNIRKGSVVKCSVEKVFAYTTEAKIWPKWHGTIPESSQISQGQVGIGTTFKGRTHMLGQTSNWTAKLTEYQPYKRWGKVIDSGSVVIDDKLIFDPIEGGTKFTMAYDVNVSGFLKLLSPMIISSMRKQLKIDVINLKNILRACPSKLLPLTCEAT